MSQHNFTPTTGSDSQDKINREHEMQQLARRETIDQKAARLAAEAQEESRQHTEAVRAMAAAPKNGPAAVDQYTGQRQQASPAKPVWSAAPHIPTPSLSEGMITSIENFDENDPALAQARNAFSTATELLKQISAARDPLSRDFSKTDAQKLLLMATHAEKAQERCTRAFDNALKALTTAANDIERQLTAPLEQSTHSELCKEIRAHIKSLDKDERAAFIHEGFKKGDKDLMNATLGVPAYLVGISDAHRAMWLRQYREQKDPIAVMRLAVLRTAIERVNDNGPLVFAEFEKVQGGTHKDVKRLRGQVSASDAALAALRGE